MLFSELYGAYYNTVAAILKAAVDHPVGKNEIRRIIEEKAFGESKLNIPSALDEHRWELLKNDGSTPLKSIPTMPLTALEKQWLNAIAGDPRIRLFCDCSPYFPDMEPLFKQDDIIVFDQYSDGDDYTDETYIRNFRTILDAVNKKYQLSVIMKSRGGNMINNIVTPEYIEYSKKDDKFRLICSGNRFVRTINIGRVIECYPYKSKQEEHSSQNGDKEKRTVEFELEDKRNSLERVMLHFAHFEKQAEKIGDARYFVRVAYDKDDEAEMIIRILSFGPMIKVTAPKNFVELIKQRLINQKSCGC